MNPIFTKGGRGGCRQGGPLLTWNPIQLVQTRSPLIGGSPSSSFFASVNPFSIFSTMSSFFFFSVDALSPWAAPPTSSNWHHRRNLHICTVFFLLQIENQFDMEGYCYKYDSRVMTNFDTPSHYSHRSYSPLGQALVGLAPIVPGKIL